jgi:imidazolonepropionase-like amidohydrolase
VAAATTLLSLGLVSSGATQPSALLTNLTVIDGRGGPPRTGLSVLIERGRVAAIGPAGSVPSRPGAGTLDLSGKVLIPGLIDTHLHGPPDSAKVAAYLEYLFWHGITSARDMAGDASVFQPVARAAAPAAAPMAQLQYVAFWAGPTFYQVDLRPIGSTQGKPPGTVAWFRSIDEASSLDSLALEGKALGAHALKLYADFTPARFRGAVDAAHRVGLRAASHVAVPPIRPSEVIRSGVDVVSHAALLVWEAVDTLPSRFHVPGGTNFGPMGPYGSVRPDDPRIVAVLEEMKRRGMVLDATISTIARGISPEASAWTLKVTALAKRLGVLVCAGTDRPEEPSAGRQPALFDEIELLVTGAGFTPLEAITAATGHGAKAIGIERERGTIEVGKVADLVVLDDDPSVDVRRLRRPLIVIKAGVVHRIASGPGGP